MEQIIVKTDHAPAPIGPYNQAIQFGNLLFISGQVPIDPATGNVVTGDIKAETHMVMNNLKAILTEAGMDFSCALKTTIFLTDMRTFVEVNEVYGSYLTGSYPARETVQVSALPKNVNVEISMVAGK